MSKRRLNLYKRLATTTLSALIGLGGAAQADQHAAGPLFGGPTQTAINCRVFNFGPAGVSITTRLIVASNNTMVNPTVDSCGPPLGVNGSCVFAAPIEANLAYSCRVIDATTTGPTFLSGAAEITSTTAVLHVLPLTH